MFVQLFPYQPKFKYVKVQISEILFCYAIYGELVLLETSDLGKFVFPQLALAEENFMSWHKK